MTRIGDYWEFSKRAKPKSNQRPTGSKKKFENRKKFFRCEKTPLKLGTNFCVVTREILKILWPHDDALDVISRLAEWLADSLDRILQLQESAVRGGAQSALSLLFSLYPDAGIEVFNEVHGMARITQSSTITPRPLPDRHLLRLAAL